MKKKVSIFVAGSKELRTERYGLKALAQELNTRYNDHGVDVFVEMKSYEDFKDNQKEYNNYISHKSDMAIFVLDGRIGSFTKNEFVTAVDAFKQKQIPEIVVFLKNYEEETDGIREILTLMKDLMGDHFFYVGYDDVADLKFKAETRITRFISPVDYIRSVKNWKLAAALIAVAALLIGAGMFFFLNREKPAVQVIRYEEDKPMLLFLGGGSVAKYMEKNFKLDIGHIDGFPNTIYMGVPTGDLWNMLGEEYYKNEDFDPQNRNKTPQKFCPIFLAADTISMAQVAKAIEDDSNLKNNILIFQLHVGNDSIVTYVGQSLFDRIKKDSANHKLFSVRNGKNYQNCEQLKQIIESVKEEHVYTTSPNSGTFAAYKKILGEAYADKMFDKNSGHKVYNEHRPITSGGEFVLLGSDSYLPPKMPYSSKLYVDDGNDGLIYKLLHLYFVAYACYPYQSERREYYLPRPTRDFLEILKAKSNVNDMGLTWDEDGYVQLDTIPENGLVELSIYNKEKADRIE